MTELLTVAEFCKAAKIARSTFYVLRREGKAPVSVKVSTRTLISQQAFADWVKELEAASANKNSMKAKGSAV